MAVVRAKRRARRLQAIALWLILPGAIVLWIWMANHGAGDFATVPPTPAPAPCVVLCDTNDR